VLGQVRPHALHEREPHLHWSGCRPSGEKFVGKPKVMVEHSDTTVAVYERVIGASLERVWENVLDWEHLPWLHSGSFAAIDLEHADENGWRARVEIGSGEQASSALIELRIDWPNSCYTTSTLEGDGEGGRIVTTLDAVAEFETAIKIEFIVRDVSATDAPAVGAVYQDLYRQLWDEDEQMMQHRQRVLDRRAMGVPKLELPENGVRLGRESVVRDSLPVLVTISGRSFRIVDVEGELVAHDLVCPHFGGPLGEGPLEEGAVVCPWHGYRFDPRTGSGLTPESACKLRLASAPTVRVDTVTREVLLVAR